MINCMFYVKYTAIAFALIAAVSAVDPTFSSYSSRENRYPQQQYPVQSVQSVGYNGYASPVVAQQKVVSPYVQNYASPVVARKVVSPFNVYANHMQDAAVQREFNIEGFGERHAVQSGPVQFNYNFMKGADAPRAVAEKFVAPQVYGGYGYGQKVVAPVSNHVVHQYSQIAAPVRPTYGGQQVVYGAPLRAGPTVKKVDIFGEKNPIRK